MPIRINGQRIEIATSRLSAVLEGPELLELRNARGAVLAQRGCGKHSPPVELRFVDGEKVGVRAGAPTRVVSLGERLAHVHVADENGDVTLRLLIDDQDRLVVEPSAQTIRRGLCAVGWRIPGIARRLRLVAPFFQGCCQELIHPLVAGKFWEWPCQWEAGFVVLQGRRDGFSVATYDHLNVPKAVEIGCKDGAGSVTFHALANGPATDSVAVGSLRWIIDAHKGDWTVPAGMYREWLHGFVGADHLKGLRPEWTGDIRLALQWCGTDPSVLDAVARAIEPRRVLIHLATWRSDPYDVNYPEYRASREGKAFMARHRLSAVFVDQTLCAWNADNALVENISMAEGVVALTRELTELDGLPAIGGEGWNEMSMRDQTVAEAHLFDSYHQNCPRFDELDPVPVGHFLYADLCRTMGYANISGDTPDSVLRLDVHERLGALPSLTVHKPADVLKPNPAVRRVLDRAKA